MSAAAIEADAIRAASPTHNPVVRVHLKTPILVVISLLSSQPRLRDSRKKIVTATSESRMNKRGDGVHLRCRHPPDLAQHVGGECILPCRFDKTR